MARFEWKQERSVHIQGTAHKASFTVSNGRLCRITVHVARCWACRGPCMTP